MTEKTRRNWSAIAFNALVFAVCLYLLAVSCLGDEPKSLLATPKEPSAEVNWSDYKSQNAIKWRRGGVIIISGPSCRWCKHLKRVTLVHPEVKKVLGRTPILEYNAGTKWRCFLPNKGQPVNGVPYRGPIKGIPFLIFVRPGGQISSRAACPADVPHFVELIKREGSKAWVYTSNFSRQH